MTQVVLATHNPHKVTELLQILTPEVLGGGTLELLTMADFPQVEEPVENEVTFVGNATLKARHVAAATGLPALADDSGFAVEVLGGCPGVWSARWSGTSHGLTGAARDEANWRLLLEQLADVPDEHRAAAFVCAAVLALPSGEVVARTGEVAGVVAREPRGTNGFGYDPIMRLPDGRHMAELGPEEKNAISHRGRAFTALAPEIARLL